MSKLKYLIYFVVTIQISVITFLGIRIFEKKDKVLGKATVNPIALQEITRENSGDLKYFYELKPYSVRNSSVPIGSNAKNTINSDALNERYEYTPQKDEDTFRIITLGDSFTQGIYVNTADNWSEVLEDTLNQEIKCDNIKKFEVINLGVVAYDIEYSVQRYKVRGQKYNPDLLIWFTYPNDFTEIAEYKGESYARYTRQFELDKKYEQNKIHHQAAIQSSIDFHNKYSPKYVRDYAYKKMLDIHKYYSKDILLTSSSYIKPEEREVLNKFMLTAKDRINIFIQPPYPKDSYIPKDEHPSEKGHARIANDLYQQIINNKYIPCKT